MLEVQKYLVKNSPEKLTEEFGIIVNRHPTDSRFILNYCQIESYEHRFHPIVQECRGLVLDDGNNIVAKSFNRFYNLGENDISDSLFNWSNFKSKEKVDGCLQYNTQLNLWGGGQIKIGKVVEQKLSPLLIGVDSNNNIVPTKITNIKNNGKKKNWIEITVENAIFKQQINFRKSKLIVTTNHNIFINNKWKTAGETKIGDFLTSYSREPDSNFLHFVNCGLLGDGSVSGKGNTARYSESHKKLHKDYADYIQYIINECSIKPDIRVSGYGSIMERRVSKNYNVLLKIRNDWYKNGKKSLPKDISWIDDFAIAKWYMDDGSLSQSKKQKDRACFSSAAFSKKDNERLAKLLNEKYGVEATVFFYKNKYYSIRINYCKGTINKFWESIAKHIHPCMRYKLPVEYRNVNFIKYPKCKENIITKNTKIINIKNLEKKDYKYNISSTGYDIETETNNYFANNVLVHNSLISLYHYNAQWNINTRNSWGDGLIHPDHNYTWSTLVFELLNQYGVDLHKLSPFNSYVFELCSRYNKVVRDYPNPQLFHLTTFNKTSGLEIDYKINGVPVPEEFSFTSLDEILKYLNENNDNTFEGFVIRDCENRRIKIKKKEYLLLHKLRGENPANCKKNLIPFILKGCDDTDELLQYFKEFKDLFNKINKELEELYKFWDTVKSIPSQKDFAFAVDKCRLRGILFMARRAGIHPKDVVKDIKQENYLIKAFLNEY